MCERCLRGVRGCVRVCLVLTVDYLFVDSDGERQHQIGHAWAMQCWTEGNHIRVHVYVLILYPQIANV